MMSKLFSDHLLYLYAHALIILFYLLYSNLFRFSLIAKTIIKVYT
jgi:hypothetical protein